MSLTNTCNIYAPINDLGYGILARGLLSGLNSVAPNSVNLTVIGNTEGVLQSEQEYLQKAINRPWRRAAPSIAIWHETDLTKFSGAKLVAFPVFETTRFNAAALNCLSQMDAVFVCSRWAKQIVEQNLGPVCPAVHVVPAAAMRYEDEQIRNMEKSKTFTFLHVGKFEARKSQAEMIEVYLRTFEKYSVETRFMCHCFNPFDQNFAAKIAGIGRAVGATVYQSSSNPCLIIQKGRAIVEVPLGRVSVGDVFSLYKHSHMGLFASRGEGWNLPLMECLQSGLPCIASYYSAHTEYLTEENGYDKNLLLTNHRMETANDGGFFRGDRGEWAVIDKEELAQRMLYGVENYSALLQNLKLDVFRTKYTWDNMAQQVVNTLKGI